MTHVLSRLQGNYQSESINLRSRGLQQKLSDLEEAARRRKTRLNNSSEYLQFIWKADLVESWISKFVGGEGGREGGR